MKKENYFYETRIFKRYSIIIYMFEDPTKKCEKFIKLDLVKVKLMLWILDVDKYGFYNSHMISEDFVPKR